MLKFASDIVEYDPSLKNDISPEEYVDEEVTRLERALYRAKKNGKNCVVVSEGENNG